MHAQTEESALSFSSVGKSIYPSVPLMALIDVRKLDHGVWDEDVQGTRLEDVFCHFVTVEILSLTKNIANNSRGRSEQSRMSVTVIEMVARTCLSMFGSIDQWHAKADCKTT